LISSGTIQKILDYARIEEVVNDFVPLKKSGVNYKGICPFHNEKTPSFMVNPAKNIFKCFGCGESGNPVSFVMKHEHYTYPEALRYLAEKYSITIDEDKQSVNDIQEIEERESLFNLNAFAQKFFTDMLFKSEAGKAIALTYLDSRGFKKGDYEKFFIGYNPDVWDALTQHAINGGYSLSVLEKSGLTIFKDTNKCYDRFKGRIIFPIQNLTGRFVGFGGRLIGKDEKRPKYVNSPESEVYNKSKILYGLYQAKNKISLLDNCYLVEGYTDVIAMHRAKIENVVSSSGTSLTKEQINLLKRYTKNITMLFDGDPAGIKASLRGIDMILEEGMNVKIVSFPEGDDPDSFLEKNTNEQARTYIEKNAKDFIRFKTSLLLEDAKDDPIKKANLIKEIIESISLIPEPVNRSVYVKECSVMLNIGEQVLQNQLSKVLREKSRKKYSITQREVPEPTAYTAEKQEEINIDDHGDDEKYLIKFLLNHANESITYIKEDASDKAKSMLKEEDMHTLTVAQYFVEDIIKDGLSFENPIYQNIFDEIAMSVAKGEQVDESYFLNHTNTDVKKTAIDLSMVQFELSPNWEKKFEIFIAGEKERLLYLSVWFLENLKASKIIKMINDNAEKLKHTTSFDEVQAILEQQNALMSLKKAIGKKMKRVFLK